MSTTDSDYSLFCGRLAPDSLDGLRQIHWTTCAGFSGRLAPESLDGLRRIMHFLML